MNDKGEESLYNNKLLFNDVKFAIKSSKLSSIFWFLSLNKWILLLSCSLFFSLLVLISFVSFFGIYSSLINNLLINCEFWYKGFDSFPLLRILFSLS